MLRCCWLCELQGVKRIDFYIAWNNLKTIEIRRIQTLYNEVIVRVIVIVIVRVIVRI